MCKPAFLSRFMKGVNASLEKFKEDQRKEKQNEIRKVSMQKKAIHVTAEGIPRKVGKGDHMAYWTGFKYTKAWVLTQELRLNASRDACHIKTWRYFVNITTYEILFSITFTNMYHHTLKIKYLPSLLETIHHFHYLFDFLLIFPSILFFFLSQPITKSLSQEIS